MISLRENMFFYHTQYVLGVFMNHFISSSDSTQKKSEGKNILIIYSKKHFDPTNDSGTNERHYSASNLARNIYTVAQEISRSKGGRVYYVDQHEKIQDFKEIDLIIGVLSESFLRYAKKHRTSRKILFLVNSHPLWRLKTLMIESTRLKKKLPLSEFISPFIFLRLMQHIDKSILIGNEFVLKTYLDYGISKKKIDLINSGVNHEILVPRPQLRPNDMVNVVYPASHLGIRKGLWRVLEAWEKIETQNTNVHLHIIGGADTFKKELEDWIAHHPSASFYGWVESHTERYRNLLQSSHIIINPSFEEGQVGCVLEAMSTGAVPVISENCGVGIRNNQEGFILSASENSEELAEKVLLLVKEQELREELSAKAIEYIHLHHNWNKFRENLKIIIL